jgi:elongator complex protein 1
MDTTKTLYKSERRQTPEVEQDVDNKVNTICEAFRALLMGIDRKKYIQSILSTYVKSSPPDLESALQLLAEIRETSVSDAEDALKYTIFLCSAESLYNVALGMYNFTLVLMVAQQAQMDPREYLPFLQELKKLDTHYQRFRIDDHLKRHAKALKNLSQAGDERFDELIAYMQRHALYIVALEQYGSRPEQKKIILNAYGDYLSEANDFAEAALAYKLAEEPAKAVNAYRLAESWREAFALAQQLNYAENDIQNLAADLLEQLKDKRRYQEAGVIAADYAKDIEEAVDCLIKGNHWQEAIRVSYVHQRPDLIETHVKPGLLEGCAQFEEDIDEMATQFNKQQPRLKELRATKPEQNPDLPPDESLDNIDMFSDTTSMYSQFTRYTQATSRVSTVSSKSSK